MKFGVGIKFKDVVVNERHVEFAIDFRCKSLTKELLTLLSLGDSE